MNAALPDHGCLAATIGGRAVVTVGARPLARRCVTPRRRGGSGRLQLRSAGFVGLPIAVTVAAPGVNGRPYPAVNGSRP